MDLSQISAAQIVVGAAIGMALGGFWYSSVAFGPTWLNSIGKNADELGSQTLPMLGSIVASLLTAIGVALLQSTVAPGNILEAVYLGAVLGFLLIFPALLSDNLFCGWGVSLLLVQAGYRILSVVLMSVAMFYV